MSASTLTSGQVQPGTRVAVDTQRICIVREGAPRIRRSRHAELEPASLAEWWADMMLSQIIRMVESAQGAKLPIQALVDRVTAWFVPAVMLAAALTFGVWWIDHERLLHAALPALSRRA